MKDKVFVPGQWVRVSILVPKDGIVAGLPLMKYNGQVGCVHMSDCGECFVKFPTRKAAWFLRKELEEVVPKNYGERDDA